MQFTVHRDADYGFIVADASIRARSFAIVPTRGYAFDRRADAQRRADELNALDATPETMSIETPDRFEAVADTLYGPAWD